MGNGNLWRVTYSYNLGGLLEKVRGEKSYGYDYITKLGYDKFEQRTYLKYCNGAETFYSYDPQRRRLQNLVVNAKAGTIMDNAYSYDAVSNVLGVQNNAPLPQSGKAGGQMSHSYTYDPLYRLSRATGTYKGTDNKTASYTFAMGYDNMHRITSKKQHLTQSNVQFNGTLNAGYDLTYTYNSDEGKKFQLASVRDINYRTEEAPTDSTNINNGHKYTYDANGYLAYINTSRVKRDGKEDDKASEQKYRWDEENRLLAADENYSIKREQSQTCLSYPDHPESNVKYHYGRATSSNNRIGRLLASRTLHTQQHTLNDEYEKTTITTGAHGVDDKHRSPRNVHHR